MIKPDLWIKRKCVTPTHAMINADGKISQVFVSDNETQLSNIKVGARYYGFDVRECTEEEAVASGWKPMISPFIESQVSEVEGKRVISYGTSSYGYDVRIANKFKIFTNINNAIIDPIKMDDKCYVDHEGDYCIIPPNSYILGHTIEHFNIPRNVMVVCVGKSTYARAGCLVNVTPIEPGFQGQVVIEISNATPLPMKIYANQGIAQFMFFESDESCGVSYADKNGKYQGQTGIVTARV